MRLGTFTILYPCASAKAAAPFTNQTPLLFVALVARFDPQPARIAAYRRFAVLVPLVYTGVFLLAQAATAGIWWDWNVSLGAWCWAGVAGLGLSYVGLARRA